MQNRNGVQTSATLRAVSPKAIRPSTPVYAAGGQFVSSSNMPDPYRLVGGPGLVSQGTFKQGKLSAFSNKYQDVSYQFLDSPSLALHQNLCPPQTLQGQTTNLLACSPYYVHRGLLKTPSACSSCNIVLPSSDLRFLLNKRSQLSDLVEERASAGSLLSARHGLGTPSEQRFSQVLKAPHVANYASIAQGRERLQKPLSSVCHPEHVFTFPARRQSPELSLKRPKYSNPNVLAGFSRNVRRKRLGPRSRSDGGDGLLSETNKILPAAAVINESPSTYRFRRYIVSSSEDEGDNDSEGTSGSPGLIKSNESCRLDDKSSGKGAGARNVSSLERPSELSSMATDPWVPSDVARSTMKLAMETVNGVLPGMIFGCSSLTFHECMRLQLFGLPGKHKEEVLRVAPGTKLFLFNFDTKELSGNFVAVSPGGMWIYRDAFREFGSFPAQVRVVCTEMCPNLTIKEFSIAIAANFFNKTKFKFDLNVAQAEKLTEMFRAKAKSQARNRDHELHMKRLDKSLNRIRYSPMTPQDNSLHD